MRQGAPQHCRILRTDYGEWRSTVAYMIKRAGYSLRYNRLMHKFISLPALLSSLLGALLFITPSDAQISPPPATYPDFPSETPAKLVPATGGFDHARRDVMIPMRDGVKLHTVILVPKDAKGAPILLTRTPYNATNSPATPT